MNRRALALLPYVVALALPAIACSDVADRDGGVSLPDGTLLDGAVPPPSGEAGIDGSTTPPPPPPDDSGPRPDVADMRVPRCGDGILDPGESCDDSNEAGGDGCSATCSFEARCGDRRMDPGEVCDDGNNASADGCRSDCLSDESCGNGEVDIAAGEICDDGNNVDGDGCAARCRTVDGCGDGSVASGETCDDSNTDAWDGCGADCRNEQSLVLDFLELADEESGCDFSGDGNPDNALSGAFGGALGFLNPMISDAFANGDVTLLLGFLGLDDPTGFSDPSLRVGLMSGSDADDDPMNNLGGMGEFFVDGGALESDLRTPDTSFESHLAMSQLDGGPEDLTILLPTGFFDLPLQMRRGRLSGATRAESGRLAGMSEGIICGAVPARALAALPNPLDFLGGGGFPGGGGGGGGGPGGGGGGGTLLDLLIGGATVVGIRVGPASLDVDLDGDGLESFVVERMGRMGPGRIVGCIDGDGTTIDGPECVDDVRMQDGLSAALLFTAVRARIVGIR